MGSGLGGPLSPIDEFPVSRRGFLTVAALGAIGMRRGVDAPPSDQLLYVGTYTTGTKSKGIYLVRMGRNTGTLRLVGPVAETTDPSFLVFSPDDRLLFAVNETTEFQGKPSGAVSAFRRDRESGLVTFTNRVPSLGGAPCYVSLDRRGNFALVANYVGGSIAVFPVRKDGSIGDAVSFVQHTGHGADPERQAAPHAHCIIPARTNRHVLVADLGLDRVLVYGFDSDTGKLSPAPVAEAAMAPGAGPRHLVFHPRHTNILYVVNELDSTIATLRFDEATGRLDVRQVTSTTDATKASVRNAPADVHVHLSGRYLYMSNRGHNTIAAFAIDPTTSTLTRIQLQSTGGDWPRNFAIDLLGSFLLVANQRSNRIVTFRIDLKTGKLSPTRYSLDLPAPVCLRFLPLTGE